MMKVMWAAKDGTAPFKFVHEAKVGHATSHAVIVDEPYRSKTPKRIQLHYKSARACLLIMTTPVTGLHCFHRTIG